MPLDVEEDEPGLAASTAVTVLSRQMVEDVPAATASLTTHKRLRLLVIGESTFATSSLPDVGELTLGRSRSCDVCIEDALISRHHATLYIGDTITVEDQGSANGTTVRNERIPPRVRVEIQIGDLVSVGHTNLIVQERGAEPPTPRRTLARDAFDRRFEEECARSAQTAAMLGHVRISLLTAEATDVEDLLSELVRGSDVIGAIGPHVLEVLLLDTPPATADSVARRIAMAMRERTLDARVTVACGPRDGSTVATLRKAHDSPPAEPATTGIVVVDEQMRELYRLVERVANSNLGVLILGETGVGKEVFAAAVHRSSPRASGPFVQLNCASLSEALLESELFGHEKGAFTNAVSAKIGLLESGDGGTVFLDEVGDMPPAVQAKLLRVIETQEVRRLGSVKSKPIDVRYLAATHHDLEGDDSGFRRDLFFRLNGITITIPPLRKRASEIEPLARAFATRAAAQGGRPVPDFTPEVLELLRTYPWPGNVRELKNLVERAVLLSTNMIDVEHLPAHKLRAVIQQRSVHDRPTEQSMQPLLRPEGSIGKPKLDQRDEMALIVDALERASGNQTKAAELLGISRRTLINRLDEYGFARPRKKKPEAD